MATRSPDQRMSSTVMFNTCRALPTAVCYATRRPYSMKDGVLCLGISRSKSCPRVCEMRSLCCGVPFTIDFP